MRRRASLLLVVLALALAAPARGGEAGGEKFLLGPYLQEPGKTSMTVMWMTGAPVEATLRWGAGTARDKQMKVSPGRVAVLGRKGATEPKAHVYAAVLKDLKPGTAYGYELACGGSKATGSFRTFPAKPGPFTFIAYGDSRHGTKVHRKIGARFAAHKPAFILHTGDMIHSGNYEQWKPFFFEPLVGVLENIPLVPVVGNHENGYKRMGTIFNLPGGFSYYSFDYADVHVVVLDSGVEGMSRTREYAKAQLAWCAKDLAASKARWKIVAYHRASYDMGHHRSAWFRRTHLPLFRKHGVDLTLAAHSHSYQRFWPMVKKGVNEKHPITHVITAGGGAPVEGYKEDPHLACGKNAYHYMVFTMDGGKLTGQALSPEGKVLDSFVIEKKKDGSFAEAYLKQALREGDFGRLGKSFSKISLPDVPAPGKPVTVKFRLSAGSMEAKYEVRVAPDSARSYEMEPVSGTLAAGGAEVTVVIKAKGPVSAGKRGRLSPALQLECAYEIAGKKGTVKTYRMAVRKR